MREFETTFIVQPEISDEGCKALCDRLDGQFDKAGSVRLLFDDQGKRKLAYEIENFQKGRYVTVSYFDPGAVVPEVERTLRLDESVLRFLTVRVADSVTDIEGRKAAAAEEEKLQAERAAERAAREAEERAAREAEAPARAEEAAAAAEAGAGTEAGAVAEGEEAPAAPETPDVGVEASAGEDEAPEKSGGDQ